MITQAIPSTIIFQDVLFLFFIDDDWNLCVSNHPTIYYWSSPKIVSSGTARIYSTPVPVIFNGALYVYFMGLAPGIQCCSTADGENWTDHGTISNLNESSYTTPSVAVFNNQLYMMSGNEVVTHLSLSSDGVNWSEISMTNNLFVPSQSFVLFNCLWYQHNMMLMVSPQGTNQSLTVFNLYNGNSWQMYTSDSPPPAATYAQNCSYMNGINYFCYLDESNELFVLANAGIINWSTPISTGIIAGSGPNAVGGGTIMADPNSGYLIVSYYCGPNTPIQFIASPDQGQNWIPCLF